MFSFTLSEKFKAKGLPSDLISPALRNRYDAIFSEPNLDRRIQVRLGERAIRFFIYTGELNENLSVEEKYVEIASISLTDVKETDRDILFFREQCENNTCVDSGMWQRLESFVNQIYNGTLSPAFPYIAERISIMENSEKQMEENKEDGRKTYVFFMQCCLLYFVLDFENRDSDFSNSDIYDEVRDKLRRSFVYRLLCAKLKYTLYLIDGKIPQSEEEYSFKVGAFADLLMDKTINKVIPSSYYLENSWFYNPEEELEKIIDTYNAFQKDPKKKKEKKQDEDETQTQPKNNKESLLNEGLLKDIRDFFFTKHAVIAAMKISSWGKARQWYIAYLVIVGIFSLLATCCLLGFVGDSWLFYIWIGIALAAIFLGFALGKVSSNILMPRILVALSIGWLTAFISEDLIKSQLETNWLLVLVMLISVLFIIGILLHGEAKQHSPYYFSYIFELWRKFKSRSGEFKFVPKRTSSSIKLTPILVHSYFWAITFGLLMQFVLYPGLLKNSQALPEIVFQDTFDDAEDYVMELSNFKSSLTSYREDLDGMFVKAGAISGIVSNLNADVVVKQMNLSYSEYDLNRIGDRGKAKVKPAQESFAALKNKLTVEIKSLDSIMEDSKFCIGRVEELRFGSINYLLVDTLLAHLGRRIDEFHKDLPPIVFDQKINEQLSCLDSIIFETDAEIQKTRLFISSSNRYETLIGWSTNKYKPYERPAEKETAVERSVSNMLLNKAINRHPFSKRLMFFGSEKFIFPRMLILHALMVLIIAFVGQLIISDKSVTEPL